MTEQFFYWAMTGAVTLIGVMMGLILRSIIMDIKNTKTDVIVIRSDHSTLRVDHEKLSKDVTHLLEIVRSNEKRDGKRMEVIEEIVKSWNKKR